MRIVKTALLSLTAIGLLAGLPTQAQAFSDKEKEEIGQLVREYILENPSIVLEAAERFRAQEKERADMAAKKLIEDNYEALTSKDLPSLGNPDADVTIVEFFDYNCGYCKRALPDIVKLTEEDPNVRVVFHEMPILSSSSRLAALWALAAHEQGKYFEYHAELMKLRGSKSEATLEKIAKDLDLDIDQMRTDVASDTVKVNLVRSIALAEKIGVQGTPAFIVGNQFFRGYIGHDGLVEAIKQEREEG